MAQIKEFSSADLNTISRFGGVSNTLEKINGVTVVATPAATFLLDSYPNAAGAWSVRRLYSLYTGACMRIREDSGDTETDIGFDSNGDLDTAAIASHCGSANGYVTKWYGQESSGGTGSGNDAENSTQADQPQIYNGSAVITNNGVSALQFDNSQTDRMFFTAVTSVKYITAVCGVDGTSFSTLLSLDTPSTSTDNSHRVISGNKWYFDNTGPQDWFKEANGDAYINGTQVTGRPAAASQQLVLAWNTNPASQYGFKSISTNKNTRGWYGKIQEIVIYENTDYSDSTNRSGIESDQNTYFSIY